MLILLEKWVRIAVSHIHSSPFYLPLFGGLPLIQNLRIQGVWHWGRYTSENAEPPPKINKLFTISSQRRKRIGILSTWLLYLIPNCTNIQMLRIHQHPRGPGNSPSLNFLFPKLTSWFFKIYSKITNFWATPLKPENWWFGMWKFLLKWPLFRDLFVFGPVSLRAANKKSTLLTESPDCVLSSEKSWLVNLTPPNLHLRNTGLIAGLIKGNQWLSQALIIRPARGLTIGKGVGWQMTEKDGTHQEEAMDRLVWQHLTASLMRSLIS